MFFYHLHVHSKIFYNKTTDINKVNKVINNILLEAIYKPSLILNVK